MTRPINTVLVYVREDLLGDALLKRPFLYALREIFPKAHITWCAGGGKSFFKGPFAPLVKGLLDEVIEHPLGVGFSEILRAPPFKGADFDLIIDTQRDLWPTLMLKRIPHKMFLSRTAGFLWSDYKTWTGISWRGHLSERLVMLLSLYKGRPMKRMVIRPVDLAPYKKNIKGVFQPQKTYIGLAPGAGGAKKCWPLDRFIAVAQYCVTQHITPVFILGPSESAWAPYLRVQCPQAIFPLQDHPNLLKDPLNTAALGEGLCVTLANDAGVGHLLGLSSTYLISLFGPTDPAKVRPLARSGCTIQAQDFGGRSMDLIPKTAVIQSVKKFMKKR